jgi:hypothetical protein
MRKECYSRPFARHNEAGDGWGRRRFDGAAFKGRADFREGAEVSLGNLRNPLCSANRIRIQPIVVKTTASRGEAPTPRWLYLATNRTAPEIIMERADATRPEMG